MHRLTCPYCRTGYDVPLQVLAAVCARCRRRFTPPDPAGPTTAFAPWGATPPLRPGGADADTGAGSSHVDLFTGPAGRDTGSDEKTQHWGPGKPEEDNTR